MKNPKFRDAQKILMQNGYREIASRKGSHVKFVNSEGDSIVLSCRNVNPMMWRRIVKQWNIDEGV